MSEKLDTQTIIDALEDVSGIVVDGIYPNWVGVLRAGTLLGFIVHSGVRWSFRPADDAMLNWWHERPQPDDENP